MTHLRAFRQSSLTPPPRWIAPTLSKRAILFAYSWHVVSAKTTQAAIDRLRIWSA